MDNNIRLLLGIKDPHLEIDPKFGKNYIAKQGTFIVAHLIQTYSVSCPKCGQPMLKNGFKTVNYLHDSAHGEPVIWSIRKQKFICKRSAKCPHCVTRLAQVTDVAFHHHIAKIVKSHIAYKMTNNESQKDIAKDLHVSDWTVRRVIQGLDHFFQPNFHWLPRHLAFDDFKSGRFAPSGMSMILMNIENKRTLDILLSRRSRYLRTYFLRYDRSTRMHVQTVTVDLFSPYRKLIHELFPHAIILADHFHVVAQAYRALNTIRINTMKRYGSGSHEWRALKHYWKLLVTPAGNLKYDNYWSRRNFAYAQLTDVEVIHRLLAFDSDLKQAYQYYQALILAVNRKGKQQLKQLLKIKLTILPTTLQKVQRTLRLHKAEIIASFNKLTPYTNGPVEGSNNKIKVIKRTAYGFRNFYYFRVRILLAFSTSYFAINWQNKQTAHTSSKARAA